MRKTTAILLCALLLVLNIVPFASAEEVQTVNAGVTVIKGVWKLNENLSFSYDDAFADDVYFRTVSYNESTGTWSLYGDYYRMKVQDYGSNNYDTLFYVSRDPNVSTPDYPVYDFDRDKWLQSYDGRASYIYFDEASVTQPFYFWLSSNATKLTCDNTSCSVGDSDGDGYCEDCYRMMRVNEPLPVYPSYLPLPPSEVGVNNWEIIIMNDNGVTKLYAYNNSLKANSTEPFYYVWGNSNNNNVILEATHSSATGNAYKLVGDSWEYTGILGGDYTIGQYENIIYSSKVIYDENGEYFFPLTLWAQIQRVTQGEMNLKTMPTITSSAVSLVLCGIGCLALLILLPILVKVLRRYL